MDSVLRIQDTVFQGVQGNPKNRELIQNLLENFKQSQYEEMRFPSNLNPNQRKIAHIQAGEFGFTHESEELADTNLKELVIRKSKPVIEEIQVQEELVVPIVELDMPDEIYISCVECEEGYVCFELSWNSYSNYIVESINSCFSEKPEEGESNHVLQFVDGRLDLIEGNTKSIVIDYLEEYSVWKLVFRYQSNHFSTFRIDNVPPSGSVLISFNNLPTSKTYTLSTHSSNSEFDSISTHLKVCVPCIKSGKLYIWGNNSHAQQGFVDPDAILTPRVHPCYSDTIRVTSISAGNQAAAMVNSVGEVHTWGLLPNVNERGEYGLSAFSPYGMHLDENVLFVKVSCGENYMGALSITGDIYTWGYGIHLQLGTGMIKYAEKPVRIDSFQPEKEKAPFFVDISCGSTCVLACSDEGKLYEWGNCIVPYNSMYVDLAKPKEMLGYHGVVSVSAGNRYQGFISEGIAYTWGLNIFGQCGLGHTELVTYPVAVNLLNLSKVVCGEYHTVFLTKSGEIYGCGLARDGALGFNSKESVCSPSKIPCEFKVDDISAASVYTLVLNANKQALACGSGKLDCLGIGVAGKASKLRKLRISGEVQLISAGYNQGISIVSTKED